ncbi:MAG TPA: NAD(P)/FAD-dependent oxidoreductase [Bacteroidia bacterium]|nr:NAD(P)/FAD-dependent oxidoreductase [Bacteroidia bacterium]
MTNTTDFDVIIIGGSYSGLSAALSLARALRNVLIIDSGQPCNRQTPHAHNFLTQDGKTPAEVSALAREQVLQYPTVQFYQGLAVKGSKRDNGFEITTRAGDTFTSRKLLFATGVKDVMPDIKGFAECWGISALHCPYCHGYEVRGEKTAVIANGEMGYEFTRMISQWTKDLTLLTNGPSALEREQAAKLEKNGIRVIETEIISFEHDNGYVKRVALKDGTQLPVRAVYAKPKHEQNSDIPITLGCELTEHGYIKADMSQKTSVHGVYACGDNSQFIRSLSIAISAGTLAGTAINRELIEEDF